MRIISGALAGALLLMSPGFPAYQALAAETAGTGAAGLPAASFAPMLRQLSQPQAAGLDASVVSGVEVAPLLQTLSSVDLESAEGRARVQPVADALSRLPAGASRDEAIAAIAGAMANVRADATGDLGEPAQAQAVSRELARRRESTAHKILSGAEGWNGNGDRADSVGAMGREASTRAHVGVAASELRQSTPAPAQTKNIDVDHVRRKTALISTLGAATGLIALFHGISLLTLAVALGSMLSIVAHEAAHLKMARAQGDDTAQKQGITRAGQLIDPLGTVALPAFTAALTGALFGVPLVFGWAKPVPVDFNRPGNVKRSAGLIAAAGPMANFALAAGFGLLAMAHPAILLTTLAKINLLLGAFNLLPAGPQFDGFKVLVSFLPRNLYERLTRNERVAPAYQSTFQKLYEGPSALLNKVGMDGQGKVNRATRMWTLAAFSIFALAAHAWLGGPVLLLTLVCSYDYYCIREKIQNEAAVKALTDILQGFASELAKAAEEDESIQSTINTEEVEHVLKNALEDILDKVIDSDGFGELTDEQKFERFQNEYTDAAVKALHQKGMSADSEETIRTFLHKNGSRFFDQLKDWAKEYDVFTKWHSPKRKSDSKDELSQRGEKLKSAGKAMAILGAAFLGAHFGLPHAAAMGLGLLGTVAATTPSKPKTPTFQEALEDPNLKLSGQQKAFLLLMLSEMKLEEKPPVIGRIEEMSEVYKNVVAPRGGINSVVLVGKAGVGKTAIPEKLAQALALAELQPDGTFALNKMKGRYLLKLNLSRLLSQDDPPKALDALIATIAGFNDVNKRSGNKIVLFIDEIHQIFLHPKGDLMANILKEPLRDGSIAVIAATTEAEYKKYMENDEAFRRRMVPIPVKEASVAETLRMLQGTRAYYEGLYQLSIHPDALKTAAELSKYDQELFLPGRAFHPLTEALKDADYEGRRDRLGLSIADSINELQYVLGRLAEELKTTERVTEKIKGDEPTTIELYNAAVELSKKLVDLYRKREAIPAEGSPTVTADMVKEQIAKKTGVKSGMLTLGREPMDRYLDMEKIVGERVIGQEDAVHAIAEAVRRNKAGLSDPKRPLGVFYLTGPTGSGKTHLAKELARFLFDDPEAVIRVDMSEYMESHSVSKFIGSPPGYVGYGEGGQLTEKVRKKSYSVVLFDEIEKANPDVWLIMLQILGDGRLTDGQGRTVDFKNTIVLMTSNLGMYALNDMLDPYVKAFVDLQQQLDAARASGNAVQVAAVEAQQRELSEKLAKETKQKTDEVTKEAFKKTYPPEFEGRLSAPPIVFNRITPEMAADIVKLNLKELSAVMDYAGHELAPPSPDVVKFLVEKGFDVRLGARPLQNAIDRHISQPVARKLLEAAKANGDSPKSSRVVLSVKNGAISIDVAPLPPKAVSKKDAGEGASQEVFSQALNLAMHAASDKVAPEATLDVIDAWVRSALEAYPVEAIPAAKPETSRTEPEKPKLASDSSRASAPTQSAPAPLLFHEGTAPLLGLTAVQKTSAHYDFERKDANVREFSKKLAVALEQAGYPERSREALLLGFLKLFVEQAKKMTPSDRKATNVQFAFEVTETGARVVIHRNGPLGDKELALLKTHFAGVVPVDAASARDKAEALNVMGKDGRRLFFDLYRVLSDMPGARLGVATGAAAQGGAGTDYWIELLKPAAPEPPPPPAPTAQAEPSQPTAQAPTEHPEGLVQAATTGPIMSQPKTQSIAPEGAAVNNPKIRRAIGQAMTQAGGFSRSARIGAMDFLSAVGGFLRDRAGTSGANEQLTLAWQVTPQETTIVFRAAGRDLGATDLAALQEMFRNRSNLRNRIEGAQARVYAGSGERSFMGSGASVWVVFPAEPVSQADGFAGETPAADASASDASPAANAARPISAIARGKISTPTRDELANAGEAAERIFWIRFRSGNATLDYQRLIHPLIHDDGTQVASAFDDGRGYRAQLRAADVAAAAQQASLLAEDAAIAEVIMHPAAFARLGLPPSALMAADREPIMGESGGAALLDDSGESAVLASDFSTRLRGQGYDYGRRRAMKDAVIEAMGFMITRAAEHVRVQARWESDNTQARFLLVSGSAFGEEDVARLRSLFESSPLAAQLLSAGGRIRYHAGSLWIDVPRQSSLPRPAPAAAPQGLRAVGWRTFELDVRKHNPQDQAFRQAQRDLEAALQARYGASSPEVIRLARRFTERAANFAKERARLHAEKVFIEWRLRGDGEFELAVRRESLQPKSFQSAIWQSSLQGMTGMRELMEAAGARLVNEAVPMEGKHSHRLALFLPRPELLSPARPVPPVDNLPTAVEPPTNGTHAEKAHQIMRRFAKAVLAQGDERGPTVLYSAGDLLGAVSTPEDLAKARQDVVIRSMSGSWAKIAAAAGVIARQGNRADDEALLRQAVSNANWGSDHLLNPMRRRVAEALTTLLATDNPERLDAMAQELRTIEELEAGSQLLAYALYLALARHGGPQYQEILVRRASESRSQALADYLRRNNPEFLKRFYLEWRSNKGAPSELVDRLLTLHAIGDYAEAGELPYVVRLVITKWSGDLSTNQIPIAGAMLGRYVARLGLYEGDLKREIKNWQRTSLENYDLWNKSIAAAEVIGEAGAPGDAAELEAMLRFDPGEVSFTNEITQASAAMAWARLVNRTGLIDRYMTEDEPGQNGQPAQTRIVKMLTDRNAIVNKAALEAVRLYFTAPRSSIPAPAAARRSVLGEQTDHPRFTTGPVAAATTPFDRFSRPDEDAAGDPMLGPWLARLPDARVAALKAWSAAMKDVLGPLLGGTVINRDVQIFPVEDEASAPVILAWTLFQNLGPAVPAATASRAKELVLLLLHLTNDAPDVRQAKLEQLEREAPGARRAYEAAAEVAKIPGARLGYDYDESRGFGGGQSPFKLWLALDGSSFSPKPAP